MERLTPDNVKGTRLICHTQCDTRSEKLELTALKLEFLKLLEFLKRILLSLFCDTAIDRLYAKFNVNS